MANWAALKESETDLPVVKRAKHGIHFLKDKETVQADFCGKPCHYQDSDGLWKPIDTKLIQLHDGSWSAPHSDVRIYRDGYVKVEGSNYQQFMDLPLTSKGKVKDDRIIRKFPGGEQHLILTEDGFREELLVEKRDVLLERFLAKATKGTLPSKYTEHPISAVDADGNGFVYNQNVDLFQDWLRDAKYPVTIDPDFTADTGDGFLRGRSTTYATARGTCSYTENTGTEYSVTSAKLGSDYYVDRPYLYFDTSSIGAGSTVNQVNMKMTTTDRSGSTDFDVVIRKYDYSAYLPITSDNRDTVFDGILAATSDDAILCKFSDYNYNKRHTSGNLSTAWVNKSGVTYYGLINSADIAGTTPAEWNPLKFASANHATEAYRPLLTVLYTLPVTFGITPFLLRRMKHKTPNYSRAKFDRR